MALTNIFYFLTQNIKSEFIKKENLAKNIKKKGQLSEVTDTLKSQSNELRNF